MTTNFAEVYNWELHGARSLPLVGIIEFFLYRSIKYFRERYAVAVESMADNQKIYGYKMTEYMDAAQKKALLHRVRLVGSIERLGGRRERHTQECVLQNNTCICSCQKPQLLHKLCTHVIPACMEAGEMQTRMFVPHYYYYKEMIWQTWGRELFGYHMIGSFIDNPRDNAIYMPDHPDKQIQQGVGRRKKKRIRNNMDRSEAGLDVHIC